MQRPEDGGIVISCDFTGIDWDERIPMIEGHQGSVLSLEALAMARDAGVWLVGTEFTIAGLAWADPGADLSVFQPEHDQFIDRLRRAKEVGLPFAYGSDAVFRNAEDGRGIESLDVLHSWREAGLTAAEQLKGMTSDAAAAMRIEDSRGTLAPGMMADIIAMPRNPLEDTLALFEVDFVMHDGVVYKQ